MAKEIVSMLDEGKPSPVIEKEPGFAPPLQTETVARSGRGRHPNDCPCEKCKTRRSAPKPVTAAVIESAWQGLFLLIRLIAGIFGYQCDVATLPMDECKEDAQVLILIPGIDRLKFLQWIGAPIVIVKRITQHFTKKAAKIPEKLAMPEKTDGGPLRSVPKSP